MQFSMVLGTLMGQKGRVITKSMMDIRARISGTMVTLAGLETQIQELILSLSVKFAIRNGTLQ